MIWACGRISARKTVPITPRAPTDVIGSHRAVAIAFPRLAKEKRSMRPSVRKLVAAVSAGGLDSNAIVHLNYGEDQTVTVDFNLVLTRGVFVEAEGLGRRVGV